VISETDPQAPRHEILNRLQPPRSLGALVGLLVGLLAVATSSVFASLGDAVTPVRSVGNSVIDRSPLWLKDLAIALFGTANKTALQIGIVFVVVIVALILGASSISRPTPLLSGITLASFLAALSALEGPSIQVMAIVAPLLGGLLGATTAALLLRTLGSQWPKWWWPRNTPGPSQVPLGWDRRRFMRAAGVVGGVTVIASSAAIATDRRRTQQIVAQIPDGLPPVNAAERADPAPPVLVDEPEYITPTDSFYRIDTALSFPSVDLDTWSVRIFGLVDREIELSYDDLLRRPQIERTITICCVSNEVGGPYIGNAVWQGVALADVLREAGVQDSAEQIFSRSIDGWTCGFPVDAALDGRDALIAIGMNGAPLPIRHGFPARLIVPGLYGYVSATKWLSDIELNRWDDERGFWIPRGWARDAPIKTHSRIDVPRSRQSVSAGMVVLAGVAWAPGTGVAKVEVRVDNGEWVTAQLSDDVTDDAWRIWHLNWEAETGTYTVQVRATDKSGYTQTEVVNPVAPDGATGWHTRRIKVT
jgi:DMSO/TMAO reductase YedYZ molybdopterin-dependent catalytic subunit